MEILNWIGSHIELVMKFLITVILFIPFIKTWKACEDEIESCKNILNNQSKTFIENIQRANEYCDKFCKIDLTGITDTNILQTEINLYNQSITEYKENFLKTLIEQDEKIAKSQEKLFNLRKNTWKSILPFLSAIALMWLGIKF